MFGSVGVRLGMAGPRQIPQPRYTAEVILSLTRENSVALVRELGFANQAVGLIGLASLSLPPWRTAAAVVLLSSLSLQHIPLI